MSFRVSRRSFRAIFAQMGWKMKTRTKPAARLRPREGRYIPGKETGAPWDFALKYARRTLTREMTGEKIQSDPQACLSSC